MAVTLRALAVFGLPVLIFLIAVGATLARNSNEPAAQRMVGPLEVSVRRAPGPDEAPAQMMADPPSNRADCAAIRGSAYQSPQERDWFLANCNAAATPPATATQASSPTATRVPATAVATATPAVFATATPAPVASARPPAAPVSVAPATTAPQAAEGEIYGSNDRLMIKRLGINAPVNIRTVGMDGILGNPLGANDVVLYDFSGVPGGLGGYPGQGGNTVIAGHVDYICCLAVFAPLRNVKEGDLIDYITGDGSRYTYSVQWFADYPEDSDWNSVVTGGNDVLTLFTCNGTFNSAVHSYDHRRVVRAIRVQS